MAYNLLQVSMSMSFRSECLADPASAGSIFYPCRPTRPVTSCRMRKALDHSVTDAPHLFQTATRMGSPSDLRAR